jgi:hypothetical protein
MKVILGTLIVPTTVFIILLITFGIFLTLFPQFIYAQTVKDEIIENTLEMVENATGEGENTLQETTENSKPTSSLEITEPFQLENITTNLSNDNEGAITTEDSIQTTEEAVEQVNNEAWEDQTVGVNETSSTIEQLKPVSDEMLEYSAEKFGINLSLPRETNVQILNRIFKDPEAGLQSFKNLEDAIDSLDDDPYGNQYENSSTLEEQLKLVQGKLNQSNSFSDIGSQPLNKQAQSVQEQIKNQTYQVEDTGKAEETENWIKGESDKLSFMYPNNWNVNISDSRFDNYELLFRDKASNASIQVSDEAIKPIDKRYMENGPERYVDRYFKFNLPLSSDANKIETYPKGKISIAGLPAYSELYLDQGNAILISLAFPEGNERQYTIVSKSPSSKYDKLEPIMLEIIKSITPKNIQKLSD